MNAMVLSESKRPLSVAHWDTPVPKEGQLLIEVQACGVCRTDLHIVDGELPLPRLPIIPGHQVVGKVAAIGPGVKWKVGERVGVTWIASACLHCEYCRRGQENLCDKAQFTGYHAHGGYSEYVLADARFCFELPPHIHPVSFAPLLCAGVIGFRCLRFAGEEAKTLGLYGFGAAGHLIAQVARHQGRSVLAFTRPGDLGAQKLALQLGAAWAGDSTQIPPVELDAAIVFAPVGALVPAALKAVKKGGTVVCGGIHMSDIPSFPYSLLWGERVVRSVANVTRRDVKEFLGVASGLSLHTQTEAFPLWEANQALGRLREGRITGAAVLDLSKQSFTSSAAG